MQIKKYILNSIILIVLLIIYKGGFAQNKDPGKDLNKERYIKWKNELNHYPVEKKAIELKCIKYFPSDKQENEDIYFYKACDMYLQNKYIFVSDRGAHRILKFDIEGKYLGTIGKKGQGPGEFYNPGKILVDNIGNLVVVDIGNQRIQIIRLNGEFVNSFKIFKSISDIIIDSHNLLYLSPISYNVNDPLIEVYDETGQLLSSFGERIKFQNITPFHNEIALAITENEELIAVWVSFDIIRKYTKNGNLIIEKHIDHKIINKKSQKNISNMIYDKASGSIRSVRNILGIKAKGNGFFIYFDYPRLEVLEFNNKCEIVNYLYANRPFLYMMRDFAICEFNKGFKRFYILQVFEENKVEIFAYR